MTCVIAGAPGAAQADPGDRDLNFHDGAMVYPGTFTPTGLGPVTATATEGPVFPGNSYQPSLATWATVAGTDRLFLRDRNSVDEPAFGTITDTGVRAGAGNVRNARIAVTDLGIHVYIAAPRVVGTTTFVDVRRFDGSNLKPSTLPTFGSSGVASAQVATGTTPVTVNDIVLDDDPAFSGSSARRVWVAYTVNPGTASARGRVLALNTNGTVDTTFGTNGILELATAQNDAVAIEELNAHAAARRLLVVSNTPAGYVSRTMDLDGAGAATTTTNGDQAVDAATVRYNAPSSPISGGYSVLSRRTADGTYGLDVRTSARVAPANAPNRLILPRFSGVARSSTVFALTDNSFVIGATDGTNAYLRHVIYNAAATSNATVEDTDFAANDPRDTGCTSTIGYGQLIGNVDLGALKAAVMCPDGSVRISQYFMRATWTNIQVDVTNPVAPAGREYISESSLNAVSMLAPVQPGGTTVDAIPLKGIPLKGIPLKGIPLKGIPLKGIPLKGIPLKGIPLKGIPLKGIPLKGIPLKGIPLRGIPLKGIDGVTWESLLQGTQFEGASLDDLTLGDVLEAHIAAVDNLPFTALDLSETPLGNVTLPTVLFAPIPLDQMPTPTGGWCAFVTAQTGECTGLDTSVHTLLDLEIAGLDLSSYWSVPREVTAQNVRAGGLDAPLGLIKLRDMGLDETSLAYIPASQVASAIPACTDTCLDKVLGDIRRDEPLSLGDATLGDLIRALPATGGPLPDFPPDVTFPLTLAEVIGGILDPGYFPLESAPLSSILEAADLRDTDLVHYTITANLDCDQGYGASFSYDVPSGTRIAGRITLNQTGSEQTNYFTPDDPSAGHFDLPVAGLGFCLGDETGAERGGLATTVFQFDAEPGVTLGPEPTALAKGTTTQATSPQGESTANAAVTDSNDPGNTPTDALALSDGDLRTGHLATDNDVDTYTFDAPAAGTEVVVSLTHLPADADLAVYGTDPSSAVTPAGRTTSPLRSAAEERDPLIVADSGYERLDPHIEPDAQQDSVFPLKTVAGTLRASSVNRGLADERITLRSTEADQGGQFRIVVRGYNGSRDNRPYVVRAKNGPEPQPYTCITRPAAPGIAADAGAFPSLPLAADTKTLILVNRRRTAARYGATATATMMSALSTYAARSEVKGVIVPVESDPSSSLASALSAWDADPCSVSAPQAAAKAITSTIDRVSAGLSQLRHIVIVGNDDVMPQVRVPDTATYANEAKYADDAAINAKDTPLSGALRKGYILSDDPYGDFDPEAAKGGLRYVPDVGLGRLVETPSDVVGQLDQYASTNGRLSLGNAYVSGYDFLKDAATGIADKLDAANPGTQRVINDDFDSTELKASFNRAGAGVTSINAHFSHTGAISAAADRGDDYNDIVKVSDVTLSPGRLLLTIGCHAGLNDPDSALASGAVQDWTQSAAQDRAVMIANTGFGYGDTDVVAYSESLAVELARLLASGTVTAGQALMFGKQQFLGALLERTDYDAKAAAEHTLYGLPTYKIGPGGTEAPAAIPSNAAILGSGPATAVGTDITVTSASQRTDSGGVSFWTEPSHNPVVVADRPVQPARASDVTAGDGARAHGVLVTALTSHDVANVTPKISRPTIDDSQVEKPRQPGDVVFPTTLANLTTVSTPQGLRDRMTVATGQFIANANGDGKGTQRLFDSVGTRVLRSSSSDFTPPTVSKVTGVVASGVFTVAVTTTSTDVASGLVLYQDNVSSTWRSLPLAAISTSKYGGSVPLAGGATQVRSFLVQLADKAGNVGTGADKRSGYSASTAPSNSAQAPKVTLFGTKSGDIYRTAVEAQLNAGEPTANVYYSVDGGPQQSYTGRFTAAGGDGVHVLEVTSAATRVKRTTTLYFVIDRTAPTVTGTPSRGPDVSHTETVGGVTTTRTFYTSPLSVNWTCADGGSGVASCPSPTAIGNEGAAQTVTSGTASDRVGNTATGTAGPFSVDLAPPTTAVSQPSAPILIPGVPLGTLVADRISLTAGDTVAGLDGNPVLQFTPVLGGSMKTVPTVQTGCESAERRSCMFAASAGFPGVGVYDVRSVATDRAGRVTTSAPVRVTLISLGLGLPIL